MKTVFLIFVALMFSVAVFAQTKSVTDQPKNYDKQLAQKLGADDFGMKSYVLVNLITGPADKEITNEKRRNEIFAGHFANMTRLANEGKLVIAGPFSDALPYRGLFIFNVKTIEEAVELVLTDPAIKAGIFTYEARKLYASAALNTIPETHKKIQKTSIE
ncbi:MAG: YciI family protein [Pyrinomonadaceae bacterium]